MFDVVIWGECDMEECVDAFLIHKLSFAGLYMWGVIWTSLVYIHDDVMLCVSSCYTKKNVFSISWLEVIGIIVGYFGDLYDLFKKSYTK